MLVAGTLIAIISGVGILTIGVLYLVTPRSMAASFGLPVIPHPEATGWLRVKGFRDIAMGVIAGVVVITAPASVLGWVLAAAAIIPLGDAATILKAGGSRRAALGIHGSTAASMLVASVLLLTA